VGAEAPAFSGTLCHLKLAKRTAVGHNGGSTFSAPIDLEMAVSETPVPEAGSTVPAAADQPTPRSWLASHPRAGWFVAAAVVLVGGVLFVAPFVLPAAKPVVVAVVHVGREQPHVLRLSPSEAAPEEDYERYRRDQADLVKGPTVLARAMDYSDRQSNQKVADLKVVKRQQEPLAWLEKHLRVDLPRDSETLRISFEAGSPEDQLLVVTAVTGAYLEESHHQQTRLRQTRLQKLANLFSDSKSQLDRARTIYQNRRDFGEQSGGGTKPIVHAELIPEDLKTYQRELTRVRIAMIALRAKAPDKDAPVPKEDLAAYQALEQEEKLLQQRMDREAQELREFELKRPDLNDLQQEIEMLEGFAKRTRAEIPALDADGETEPRVRLLVAPSLADTPPSMATPPVPWYKRWLQWLK
jgi:hypothetical protein